MTSNQFNLFIIQANRELLLIENIRRVAMNYENIYDSSRITAQRKILPAELFQSSVKYYSSHTRSIQKYNYVLQRVHYNLQVLGLGLSHFELLPWRPNYKRLRSKFGYIKT